MHGNEYPLWSGNYSSAISYSRTPLTVEASNTNRSPLSSPNLDSGSYVGASFTCKFVACSGRLFQTQDLLEYVIFYYDQCSDLDVRLIEIRYHINAVHYCPIRGCARYQGRKGFADAAEKEIHLLMHSNDKYSCPFCWEPEVNPCAGLDHLKRYVSAFFAILLFLLMREYR